MINSRILVLINRMHYRSSTSESNKLNEEQATLYKRGKNEIFIYIYIYAKSAINYRNFYTNFYKIIQH